MMPHPERSCEALLGSEDGKVIFGSVIRSLSLMERIRRNMARRVG